jgi:hypothetical protein
MSGRGDHYFYRATLLPSLLLLLFPSLNQRGCNFNWPYAPIDLLCLWAHVQAYTVVYTDLVDD